MRGNRLSGRKPVGTIEGYARLFPAARATTSSGGECNCRRSWRPRRCVRRIFAQRRDFRSRQRQPRIVTGRTPRRASTPTRRAPTAVDSGSPDSHRPDASSSIDADAARADVEADGGFRRGFVLTRHAMRLGILQLPAHADDARQRHRRSPGARNRRNQSVLGGPALQLRSLSPAGHRRRRVEPGAVLGGVHVGEREESGEYRSTTTSSSSRSRARNITSPPS